MALTFAYGDYVFDPKPLFTISKEYIKTASQMGLGTKYVVTLDGFIIPSGGKFGDDPGGGVNVVFAELDKLSRAFDSDFKCLSLVCDGEDPIISGYPRITECNIQNASDNYVMRGNYSISLELPSLTGTGFDPVGPVASGVTSGCGVDDLDLSAYGIISYSDDFTVEFMDERVGGAQLVVPGATEGVIGELPSVFSIQRSISAQGDSYASADEAGVCDDYIHPWQRASGFVIPRLGFPPEIVELSGLLCPSGTVSNNFRSVNVNKTEGSITVNETYIAVTGSTRAYEDFEVNTSQTLGEPYITVTIDGTINGLTHIGYGGLPATGVPKFNNAIDLWSGVVSGALYSRASKVFKATPVLWGHVGHSGPENFPLNSLNSNELSRTVGYNPVAGTVTYSCTYDNRPVHCFSGAITEDVTFSESEPNDIFASLTILGKASGPLYQTIGTVGPRTRELSINAVLPMITDCSISTGGSTSFFNAPDVYDYLVLNYATVLSNNYTQVFVTASSKTWEPKTGRFSLNQAWTVGSC
jgi:hypothetical protein